MSLKKVKIQKQFQKFHDKIKLEPADNQTLRNKRNTLEDEFREWLDANWEKLYPNKPKPTFSTFNQGSYAMGTGTKSLKKEEDYDIDVAFCFNFSKDEYKPEEVKDWIATALSTKNRTVEWKYPCIRVQYKRGDENIYHVDIATYVNPDNNDGVTYLAKAMNNTYPKPRIWEKANPKELLKIFNNSEDDAEDKKQMKRIIRFTKRWKDIHFNSGNARPTGIAFTACALEWFSAKKEWDSDSKKWIYNDLAALKNLVQNMLHNFMPKYDESTKTWYNCLSVHLPVEPYNNLFEKMSTKSLMTDFENQLIRLNNELQKVINEEDVVKACEILQKELGDDFEVPEEEKIASAVKNGILGISTGLNTIISKPNGGFHGVI